MTLYAFPDSVPAKTTWRWVSDQITMRSMFGNTVQRIDFNGGVWAVDVSMPPLLGDDHRLMRNFLFKLSQPDAWAQIKDHSYTPAGSFGGTPLVHGANQTGKTLMLDGATPSVTGWIKAGDRLGLANGRVVEAASDANSDGSGNVTVTLVNPIVDAPLNNSSIETSEPAIICIIADPSVGWDNSPADFHGHAFTLVQDPSSSAPDPVY